MRLFLIMAVLISILAPASANEFVIAGQACTSDGPARIYTSRIFDPFASARFAGMWGNPAYGSFGDPDRPDMTTVYEGSDGENVTLRLWFDGVDFNSLLPSRKVWLGAAGVGETNPCAFETANMWVWWYNNDGRIYIFKGVQVDDLGNIGYGPARGWNPSNSGLPIENIFDLCLEFVPSPTAGEIRIYTYQKRHFSTEDYHYAPGRWIPEEYAWGLDAYEALNPAIKDPAQMGPENRYYNRLAGYPWAQLMNVFIGIEPGGPAGSVSWQRIRAEGTQVGASSVTTIAQAKKAELGGYYDVGTTRVTADLRTGQGLIYVRQLDGATGIGVEPAPGVTLPQQIAPGDRLTASGYTKLLDDAELILLADQISVSPAEAEDKAVTPYGMNPSASGGRKTGWQPGVVDDAISLQPSDSVGVNTIGQLVTVWGRISGSGQVQRQGSTLDAWWLDDGRRLYDGFAQMPAIEGLQVIEPADWVGGPPSGCCSITGILRSVLSPQGKVVRALYPRSATDVVQNELP